MAKTRRISPKPILFTLASLAAVNVGNAASKSPTKIDRGFEKKLPGWMAESHVPAVGIGIIEDGKVKQAKVFGEIQKGKPAPEDAVFDVASLTKPVFAMTVLRLVDAGKWDLDEPLYPYWVDPDIQNDPRHEKLTARIVLSHRTGFKNWRWNREDKKLAFEFDPGTKFQYSGEGFEYLKTAIEKKFNQPFDKIAASTLLAPLKMKDTRFFWEAGVQDPRFAGPYNGEGKPLEYHRFTNASAADGLLTTVKDYARFGADVLNGAGLSRKLYNEMVRPQVVTSEAAKFAFGLGWEMAMDLGGENMLMHTGADSGCHTLVMLFPKTKRGLVVLTNGDKGNEVFVKVVVEALGEVGKELDERARRMK